MIYTEEHKSKLTDYLASHDLPSGLGSEESACTVAAINLALTGKLTDNVPDCMSPVLGAAAIKLQDSMPDEMRNSTRYKSLVPLMPGTGRKHEQERLAILLDWMWNTVLPQVQSLADASGFGTEWRAMCEQRDASAAARTAADAAFAARAARRAASAAARRAGAAYGAADAAAYATAAARAVAAAYAADAAGGFWETVDPIGVLERMTAVGALR